MKYKIGDKVICVHSDPIVHNKAAIIVKLALLFVPRNCVRIQVIEDGNKYYIDADYLIPFKNVFQLVKEKYLNK